jgi:maltooligosyltrehalose trehalohydrolase
MTEAHRFSVWAPERSAVAVRVSTVDKDTVDKNTVDKNTVDHAMTAGGAGWWHADVPGAGPGTDYMFVLDGEALPDPRSRWQPNGVHEASRVYDAAAYQWSDHGWTGRPVAGRLIYELHVGTFTEEGTFAAAADRLDHLVDLGVDFVELMPVNAFDGTHGWGYDGVLWYAVQQSYGGPDGLKAFVDACHRRGLGVLLDVVYNHLGPSGAYLDRFGPYFAGSNVWGPSLNLDGPGSDEVRRYVIDNALRWLGEFHIDGLRLDAVHALRDTRAVHLLEELGRAVEALSLHCGRPLSLIAESDLNDPRLVTAREAGGYGLTAQWDDDLHHCLHAVLTGERQGYYADFGSLAGLADTLRGVFFHARTWSSFRGRTHGRPVDTHSLPAHRFLAYAQNHDQIGNRAAGDRLSATLSPGLLGCAAAIVLCSPYTPMIFMGEEWGATTPWQFFVSFENPELAEAVRTGRRSEFAEHGWAGVEVPDPTDPATRERSVLRWSELGEEPHASVLETYRALIALRKRYPRLCDPWLDDFEVRFNEEERWIALYRGDLRAVCNLAAATRAVPVTASEILLASGGAEICDAGLNLAGESFAIVRQRESYVRAW